MRFTLPAMCSGPNRLIIDRICSQYLLVTSTLNSRRCRLR